MRDLRSDENAEGTLIDIGVGTNLRTVGSFNAGRLPKKGVLFRL
jgi:hypothetical protein